MFSVNYSFNTVDELNAFVNNKNKCTVDAVNKKLEEKRGASTSNLHKLTKAYHEANSDMSYKEALKHVGKELKKIKKEPVKEFIIIEDDIIENEIIEEPVLEII